MFFDKKKQLNNRKYQIYNFMDKNINLKVRKCKSPFLNAIFTD